jgi:hypothetical protein
MHKYMKSLGGGTMKLLPMTYFMTIRRYLVLLAWLVFCLPLVSVADEDQANIPTIDADYQPGHGWKMPGTGFRLGGYSSAGFDDDRHSREWSFGIDNLSLFVWWEGEGKLRLFTELDLENPLKIEQDGGLTTRRAYFALERLYADYLYSEKLNLRAGKFLTPIGRWNVIHADPLVWTTSRPLITKRTFPTNVTGAMAYGILPIMGLDVDYSIYTNLGEDWRPDPKLDPFEEVFGMHLNFPLSGAGELGISYANFEQRASVGERKNLLGLDYAWAKDRYEVSAELAYRFSDEGSRSDERGLFVQAVAPISARWYAVGRYELYDPAGPAPTMNVGVLGLAMRLSPALVFKAEVSHSSNNRIKSPEGFFTSFAILF